jgi:hypothetical protein
MKIIKIQQNEKALKNERVEQGNMKMGEITCVHVANHI